MTSNTTTNAADRVVAAVGRAGSTAAVEEAVLQSALRGCPLHLVHAVEAVESTADRSWREGAHAVAVAAARAEQVLGVDHAVTTALSYGRPVAVLAEAAAAAPLVVVGRSPESRRTQPYVRSVTGGVASRVPAPVLSVPDDWQPRTGTATVVAGVDEPSHCRTVLDTAMAAAQERGARLVVLSTRWRPSGSTGAPLTAVTEPDWAAAVEADLVAAVAGLREEYADVPVEVRVRHARAGDALVAASAEADLVVVGRHTCLVPAGSHLGPVARAVLREAVCPVLLAAPEEHHRVHRTAQQAHELVPVG